jgi:hypothetical protein
MAILKGEYDKFPGVSWRGKVHLSLKHSFVKVGSYSGSYCPPLNLLIKLPIKNGRALFFESILLSLLPQPTQAGFFHSTTN